MQPVEWAREHKIAAAVIVGGTIGAVVLIMRMRGGGSAVGSAVAGYPSFGMPASPGVVPATTFGSGVTDTQPTGTGSPTGTPQPTMDTAQLGALQNLNTLQAQEAAGGNSNLSIVQTIQDAQARATAGTLSAQDQQLVSQIANAGPGGALNHMELINVMNGWHKLAIDLGAGTSGIIVPQ